MSKQPGRETMVTSMALPNGASTASAAMRLAWLVALAALMILAAACDSGSDGGATDGGETSSGDVDAPGGEGAGDQGAGTDAGGGSGSEDEGGETEADDQPPEGMISSGSAEAPPTIEPPAEVEQTGAPRTVTASEARAAVDFTLYEPAEVPDETYRDVVRLIEPVEGQDATGLPQVFFIYTVDAQSNLVLRQSPGGSPTVEVDAENEGESVDIGGRQATLVDAGGRLALGWEIDGTAILLTTSDLEREVLLSIAASLQPME